MGDAEVQHQRHRTRHIREVPNQLDVPTSLTPDRLRVTCCVFTLRVVGKRSAIWSTAQSWTFLAPEWALQVLTWSTRVSMVNFLQPQDESGIFDRVGIFAPTQAAKKGCPKASKPCLISVGFAGFAQANSSAWRRGHAWEDIRKIAVRIEKLKIKKKQFFSISFFDLSTQQNAEQALRCDVYQHAARLLVALFDETVSYLMFAVLCGRWSLVVYFPLLCSCLTWFSLSLDSNGSLLLSAGVPSPGL